jgi:hypothetical protein
MSFTEYFYNFTDFNFEISKRQALNFKEISLKLKESKAEKFIIDISINGYTSKENFDFKIEEKSWKDVKEKFVKGKVAQDDPSALTVKRAIRIMAVSTSDYISKQNIKPQLSRFNHNLNPVFCHLGAHFIVKEKSDAINLLLLWENFDKEKRTNISSSVEKILRLREVL